MKKTAMILLALICILALAGCGCEHEWVEADCTTPRTCSLCGETEGEALGHTWADATCETPKTCSVCAATEGAALGHTWTDATCETPKTCSVCAKTEGEALGHTWMDATTEAPKTCSVCAATDGERIITDARFTTAACSPLFGEWSGTTVIPASELGNGLDAYMDEFPCIFTFEFTNDGNAILNVLPADEDQLRDVMHSYTVDSLYAEFAAMDLDKESADTAFETAYGMTIDAYVTAVLAETDLSTLFSFMDFNYVYYVDGNEIYLGTSWSSELEPSEYKLENNTLYLAMDENEFMEFTRGAKE